MYSVLCAAPWFCCVITPTAARPGPSPRLPHLSKTRVRPVARRVSLNVVSCFSSSRRRHQPGEPAADGAPHARSLSWQHLPPRWRQQASVHRRRGVRRPHDRLAALQPRQRLHQQLRALGGPGRQWAGTGGSREPQSIAPLSGVQQSSCYHLTMLQNSSSRSVWHRQVDQVLPGHYNTFGAKRLHRLASSYISRAGTCPGRFSTFARRTLAGVALRASNPGSAC